MGKKGGHSGLEEMLGTIQEMKAQGTFGLERIEAAFPALAESALGLDPLQEAKVVRVLCESRLIARRTELVGWLQGDVRRVLPYQILIGAWGDFARWNIK